MSSQWERLQEIVAEALEIAPDELSPESGPQTVPAWDSVASLRILLLVEQHFGIRFNLDAYHRVATLADLERLVEAEAVGGRTS